MKTRKVSLQLTSKAGTYTFLNGEHHTLSEM